jgi:hypothetical protein
VSQLGFSTSEFAIDFTNAHSLEATVLSQLNELRAKNQFIPIQRSVQLLTACRDPDAPFSDMAKLSSSNETTSLRLHLVNAATSEGRTNQLTARSFAAAFIFSTLVSENPFILRSLFVMAPTTLYHANKLVYHRSKYHMRLTAAVWKPLFLSFIMSAAPIPCA